MRDRRLAFALLLPAVVVMLVAFLLPLANTIVLSFHGYSRSLGITRNLVVTNYTAFLTDPFYLRVLARTVRLSALTVLICLLIGYPIAAHFTASRGRRRAVIALVVLSPLLVSVIVRTYGWLVILGPGGLINSALRFIGINPPHLFPSETAVVIGLVHLFLPYMVLSIASALENIDSNLALASSNLGGSRITTFLRVTLPISAPGVLAGSLLVFALSNGSFVTPAVLGGAASQMMAPLAYQQDLVLFNWPFGSAISLILLVIVIAVVSLYSRGLRPASAVD